MLGHSLSRAGWLLLPLGLLGTGSAPEAAPRPKLVVVVVVDQMRADFLVRFAGLYSSGFARLQRTGATFTEAYHDHALTETAAGHATISTGRFPAVHGIVANEWYDRLEQRAVYAAGDTGARLIGDSVAPGRSPRRLKAPTLGDWLRGSSPASKVFAVALKDRSAILLGGARPNGVYWYDGASGRFVTSTYYGASYPAWVTGFNSLHRADRYFNDGWRLLLGPDAYFVSREDSFPAEYDGVHVTFPHLFDTSAAAPSRYEQLEFTPFGDELVLEFAESLLTAERLGADPVPDLLWISCSAADLIGHRFGPLSKEIEDYYLRLDGYLGNFLAFLDRAVGQGQYVVVLTSDHGVIPLPEELQRRGIDVQRMSTKTALEEFQPAGDEAARELKLPSGVIAGYLGGLVLNYDLQGTTVTPAQLRQAVAVKIKRLPFVADVFTPEELTSGVNDSREYFLAYRRTYYPNRSADLLIRFIPSRLVIPDALRTNHGSPYSWDTHVPLIFAGSGLVAGTHADRVSSVDIAPTVADLLGLKPPPDLEGRSLTPIVTR